MRVRDILNSKPPPVTIRANNDMAVAMRLLIDNNIGSLIVIDDDDQPIGIVTERDIFHLAFRYRGDMMDMKVGENMSSDLTVGSPEDGLDHVARIMTEQHIRHIPIIDDAERLCGIVSIGDIVKAGLSAETVE
jgi:CBS domain-containing protein